LNGATTERLRRAHHTIDGVDIVHRDVGTRTNGKSSRRLAGTPTTKNQDVAPAKAPRRNRWRLKLFQGEAIVVHP
jgi:hypothetical protein